MVFFFLAQFGAWYNNYLDTYPLVTKAMTTAVIGLLGDAAAQYHEKRTTGSDASTTSNDASSRSSSSSYDTRRGLANAANNLFLTAPIYHYGYDMLENLLPVLSEDNGDDVSSSLVGNSLAAFGQVLIDCIVFDALFVFLMYISAGTIEGSNNTTINTADEPTRTSTRNHQPSPTLFSTKSMRINLLPAIMASWQINIFMIPIEYFLFRYFPLRVRVLGMNLIDLIWEAVVSFAIHDTNERVVVEPGGSNNGGESKEGHYSADELSRRTSSDETTSSMPSSTPSSGLSVAESTSSEIELEDSSSASCPRSMKKKQ